MEDINWDRIDKQKFFMQGAGMFSGVTTLLFPLTVIKTRQMANHGVGGGFEGMKQTVGSIWRQEGVPGFYRGYATVIFGTIPARMMYLASLEMVKDGVAKLGNKLELSSTATAGLANFFGGAAASLSIQLVAVPIDVVSQRQMVHGADLAAGGRAAASSTVRAAAAASSPAATASSAAASASSAGSGSQVRTYHTVSHNRAPVVWPHMQHQTATPPAPGQPGLRSERTQHSSGRLHRTNHQHTTPMQRFSSTAVAPGHGVSGLNMARIILREEGVRGLYRGFGVSVATFVPSSAVWWSAYGIYTQLVSSAYLSLRPSQPHSQADARLPAPEAPELSSGETLGLQTGSALLAGATASLLTNPLDLIKIRIQVAAKGTGEPMTVRGVVTEILKTDGPSGFLRGVLPRMVNSAMWGTCMVSVYEFLKRNSLKDDTE